MVPIQNALVDTLVDIFGGSNSDESFTLGDAKRALSYFAVETDVVQDALCHGPFLPVDPEVPGFDDADVWSYSSAKELTQIIAAQADLAERLRRVRDAHLG